MKTNYPKIGKGYYQSGYGRGFKKQPVVYLINEKAYAKDLANYHEVTSDLSGFVPVNILNKNTDTITFVQVWPKEHEKFEVKIILPKNVMETNYTAETKIKSLGASNLLKNDIITELQSQKHELLVALKVAKVCLSKLEYLGNHFNATHEKMINKAIEKATGK